MAVDIKLKRSHTHSSIPTTSDLAEGEFAVNTYDGKMFMRDGSNNIVTVGSHYTTDFEPSTKTFYVTVASSTSAHVHHGSGSSNKYKINGAFSPFLRLIPGITYRFDQSDSSNSGHPFRFYLDENKNTSYTTGVTTNGTAGSSGAYTEIVVSHSTPSILHYQCSAHGLMGWAAFVNTSNLTAFDTGDLTEGSNLYYTDSRAQSAAQAVSINNVVEDTTPQLGGNLDVNAKNINFGDSASSSDDRLNFGAGTDLSIYHNGAHNRIDSDSNLYYNTGANVLTIVSGDEVYETKDFGISGSRTGTGGAIGRLRFINRAGSSTITDNNSETRIEGWRIQSHTPSLTYNFGGTERHRFDPDGKVALGAVPSSFANIVETVEITGTLKTTSTAKLTGVQLLGDLTSNGNNINLADNDKAQFGASQDLQIYHNGSHSVIEESGTGNLNISSNYVNIYGSGGTSATFYPGNSVDLYYNNSKKFETTTTGIQLTSTDTSSSAGPELVLYRNSASPADADYIGQLQFKGRHDGGGDEIYAKVTGKIVDATQGSEDGLIETAIKQNGSFNIVSRQKSNELQLLNGVGLSVAGSLTASGLSYPTSDGSANHVITTDGSGNLSFASVGTLSGAGIANVADDTTPQLGGNLDVVTHSIVSTSNRDINLTPNGTGKVVIGTNGLEFGDGTVQTTAGGAGGSGESVSWSVTQTSHGLAVGDVIYNNGTNYVKAQANATGTLGLFVVSAVADANTFTATFSGKITLSSLTAGQYYFVSTTTAGAYVTTEPTSGYSNPILFALSTTEAVVLPYRPQDLTSGGAAGARTALDVFSKAETNQQVSAFAIALG